MGKPLRARPWWQRYADDPLRYGIVWREVKKLPCFGRVHLEGHRCSGKHTAHHDPPVGKRGDDLSGQLPVCASLHDQLHGAPGRTRADLLEEHGITEGELTEIAGGYVQAALRRLVAGGQLPDEIRDEAQQRGYET